MWTMAFAFLISALFITTSTAALISPDESSGHDRMLDAPTLMHTRIHYLALGDSYAAGVGSGGGLDSIRPTDYDQCCFRNYNAYPYLLARSLGAASLDFRACGGAIIKNHRDNTNTIARQLEEPTALPRREINLVTMTVGGNDMQFAGLITSCAVDYFRKSERCKKAIARARYLVRHVIPVDVRELDEKLHKLFPSATIVFTGYPIPYPDGEPEDILCVVRSVRESMNELSRMLSEEIRKNVANFVDVSFRGHELCNTGKGTGRQTWMNGWLKSSVRMDAEDDAKSCGVRRGVFKFIGHVFHPGPHGQQQYSRALLNWYLAKLRARAK